MFRNTHGEGCFLPRVGYDVVGRIIGEVGVQNAANVWVYARDDYKRYKWAGGSGLDAVLQLSDISGIDILDRHRERIVAAGASNEMMYLGFSLEPDVNARAVEICSRYDDFMFGAIGEDEDAMWQGEQSLSNYELDGRAVPDLPRVIDVFGDEVLDVSGNVGRWFDTFGARLWAGSRMWFGEAFDAVISLDRVRSLPVGEVSELPGGGVQVRLFEEDDPIEMVRERQRVVVDWLGFRWLEEHTERVKAAYPDRFTG